MYSGATKTIPMPGGFKITIREINGDDEDKLSKLSDSKDGSAMHKFLAGIIIGNSVTPDKKVTEEDIAGWRVRDKYYALYWAVRHSHGDKVTFRHIFEDGTECGFDEDLKKFDWDFTKGTPPKLGEKGYDSKIIQPYPESEFVTGTTSSGKEYRFRYLTGIDELNTLGKNPDELSINEKLRIRGFEAKGAGGTWLALQNFASFSARDMKEIRATLEKEDPEFNLNVQVTHPKTGRKEVASLFSNPDFFFPIA